jgi:hypothetical protein
MMRGEVIFPALIFATVAAFVVGGAVLGEYTWNVFAFPLGAAVFVCVMCAIEIANALRRPATVPADDDASAPQQSLSAVAWVVALAAFLYGLGFVWGPAVYLLACLRFNGFSWLLSVGVAAASLLLTWGLFIKTMGILLPMAPLWLG